MQIQANYSPINQAYILTFGGSLFDIDGRTIWQIDELRDECRRLGLVLHQHHSAACFIIAAMDDPELAA